METTDMSPLYSTDMPIWLLGTCHQRNAVPVSGNILQN